MSDNYDIALLGSLSDGLHNERPEVVTPGELGRLADGHGPNPRPSHAEPAEPLHQAGQEAFSLLGVGDEIVLEALPVSGDLDDLFVEVSGAEPVRDDLSDAVA